MNTDTPMYDPADILISRHLKDWVNYQDIPRWSRSQLLKNSLHPSVKLTRVMVLCMTLKWVLSRGLELISFLNADEPVIFLHSRDSYYWNPPQLSPCIVQSWVKDTFLLEAGMLVVLG